MQAIIQKAKTKSVNIPVLSKHRKGEDINSLSISHEPEIFTHLLESRKEIEAFSFSTENTKKNSDEKKKEA
jgi:hypothetical protein